MTRIEADIATLIGPIWHVGVSGRGTTTYYSDRNYTKDEAETEVKSVEAGMRKMGIKGSVSYYYCGQSKDKPLKVIVQLTKKQMERYNVSTKD